MFYFLGKVICRTWWLWLIGWLALFAFLWLTTPPWNQVARDTEFGFLPVDAPTRQGTELFRKAFPDDKQASNIVIVVTRPDQPLQQEDRDFIKNVIKPALQKMADAHGGLADNAQHKGETPIFAAIQTPDDPGDGPLLVSADGRSALIVIELTTELLEFRNWPIVHKVETLIADWREQGKAPAGLDLSIIGSATVGRDLTIGQQQSANTTEIWTAIVVIVILLLIYRAPFLAIIPLISVFMATELSLLALAQFEQAGLVTLFEEIKIYIRVILYGTGVDYCLFLIARYREELERGTDCGEAMGQTIGHVGPALTASAATVAGGIGMMVFAKFGKFHHAGVAVAFGLAVSLCVVLTFTTSLMRLAGRWAFWPRKITATPTPARSRFFGWLSWEAFSQALLRRPALIWLVTVVVMAPLAVGGIIYGDHVDYNFLRRLPADAPSVIGAKALNEHFPAGAAGTITVLIYDPQVDFLVPDGKGQIQLAALSAALRKQLPLLQLADIRTWSLPLGTGLPAREATAAPLEEINRGLQRALKYYVSSTGEYKGHVTRLELTMLLAPMSRHGMASLDQIQDTVREELRARLPDASAYFLGVTADMRDLRRITSGDQLRIQILVIVCVLVILVLVLRRPVVALYLIAGVLFSYFATLGAAQLFFWWRDPDGFVGLDWKVPIFLFTILVAIGEDYNIFLMTRVAEEQATHGPIEGIRVALVKTGGIITSCGLIMAGTFASLLSGSMQDLHHLGFALAVGVLVDTFIVRPILVPTFLIVVERATILWRRTSALLEATPEREKVPPH